MVRATAPMMTLTLGGAIAAAILWAGATPLAVAQPSPLDDMSDRCKATLFDMEREIEAYPRVYTDTVMAYDIQANYVDAPRPLNLYVSLAAYGGTAQGDRVISAAQDILASPQLLTRYTEEVVTACGDIGAVTFALTEYQSRQFGLYGGDVMEFGCAALQADPNAPLPWGFRFCF